MKKLNIIMVTLTIFLFIFSIEVQAQDNMKNADISEINNNPKILKFYDYINNLESDTEILNDLNLKEYIKHYMETGEENLSFKSLTKIVGTYFIKEVRVTLKLMISLIVLAIISAMIRNLQDSFSNDNISNVAFYACFAVMIMLLSRSFLISLDLAKETIQGLADFMIVLLPVLTLLLSTAGGITQAASMDPIVLGSVILTPRIYIDIIIPLILMGFVLVFVNNLSNDHKINNICKMFKQIVMWLQGIIITIFIAILSIRGISANTIDAVALKTAKFAVDNFVPIVGKAFSDAITTMAGYSLVLKNAVSTVGLIVIIVLVLFPILKMILMIFTYKLSAALVEPIADKRIVSCIEFASESLTLVMATMLSLSVMFFIMIAIMANSGRFIVGG
ncbi:stage III sporulation protein AE [Clostridium fallax]|uniref:Stage III sporulation protein AE n=1 Tax=Clostridium fallax TaxID=1533 RepID=A0A1M4XMH8_9CLOT|nr:stage III sporulation protein AE [Clostridium fallax]SHE94794.1 stage III sporulation protein AE [Clostridium fallax]SQB06341.1 sporulation stage III, protein AE [Clostridium fallax]